MSRDVLFFLQYTCIFKVLKEIQGLSYLIIFDQLVAYADHYSHLKYLPKNLNKLNKIMKI